MIGCMAIAIMRTTKIAPSMVSMAAEKRKAPEVRNRRQRPCPSSVMACAAMRVNRSRARNATVTPPQKSIIPARTKVARGPMRS
jgi:hypothetical protein